jgi:hypothetical protein
MSPLVLNLFLAVFRRTLFSPVSLCNDQIILAGNYDTCRYARRDRLPTSRGLGERTPPDTRAGVQGVASLDVVVASGSRRCLEFTLE